MLSENRIFFTIFNLKLSSPNVRICTIELKITSEIFKKTFKGTVKL